MFTQVPWFPSQNAPKRELEKCNSDGQALRSRHEVTLNAFQWPHDFCCADYGFWLRQSGIWRCYDAIRWHFVELHLWATSVAKWQLFFKLELSWMHPDTGKSSHGSSSIILVANTQTATIQLCTNILYFFVSYCAGDQLRLLQMPQMSRHWLQTCVQRNADIHFDKSNSIMPCEAVLQHGFISFSALSEDRAWTGFTHWRKLMPRQISTVPRSHVAWWETFWHLCCLFLRGCWFLWYFTTAPSVDSFIHGGLWGWSSTPLFLLSLVIQP